ncbi:hypothetical protein P171DRAFT_479614 [Karstenula rhodostoma CBS 690.94]|uniref:Ubiquitin-like domain-containing protein n=1 Tax=Karstenula rhodostoma CBS 690.94 TaxID=1392251 RepID=A0A9P4PWH8_9PLEO|nr:hypothetical protein P171DRAFT_479614 [Karstenula rhodostoma CBS 690.94]
MGLLAKRSTLWHHSTTQVDSLFAHPFALDRLSPPVGASTASLHTTTIGRFNMANWELDHIVIDDLFLTHIPLTTTVRKAKEELEKAAATGQRIQKMGLKTGHQFMWFKYRDDGKTLAEMGVVKGQKLWVRVEKNVSREGEEKSG